MTYREPDQSARVEELELELEKLRKKHQGLRALRKNDKRRNFIWAIGFIAGGIFGGFAARSAVAAIWANAAKPDPPPRCYDSWQTADASCSAGARSEIVEGKLHCVCPHEEKRP